MTPSITLPIATAAVRTARPPVVMPSHRAASIPPSCVHEVFRAVERAKAGGASILGLHVGEPAFAAPGGAQEAVAAAVRDGRAGYTLAEGMLVLREALADKVRSENGIDAEADRVFVTPGSCQGLAALLQAIAAPDDEVLLPEIHWPIHLQQAVLAGLRPRFYPLAADGSPDVEAMDAIAGPRTKAAIVTSPDNPRGAVLTSDVAHALLAAARRRGFAVVADEAYEHFVYEGAHLSLASLERDVPPDERRVSTTFSFSKSYAMTGYRVGYVVVPNARAGAAFRSVQEATIISPSMPVQYGALAALDDRAAPHENRATVRRGRELVRPLIDAGLAHAVPAGGWYLLCGSPPGTEAVAFANHLLRAHDVAVAPAGGFARRVSPEGELLPSPVAAGMVRIAFCGASEPLAEGVGRIAACATTCGGAA